MIENNFRLLLKTDKYTIIINFLYDQKWMKIVNNIFYTRISSSTFCKILDPVTYNIQYIFFPDMVKQLWKVMKASWKYCLIAFLVFYMTFQWKLGGTHNNSSITMDRYFVSYIDLRGNQNISSSIMCTS